MTLFYEDLRVGKKFTSSYRSLRQADIDRFARLTGDLNPIHMNKDYAKGTIFGARIAHGLLVLSVAVGLWFEMGLTRDSLVALLGIDKVEFRSPVHPGDSFRLISEVVSRRPSRTRPEAGIVTLRDSIVGNGEKTLLQFERVLLVNKSGERRRTP